jgi:hypothetical protein
MRARLVLASQRNPVASSPTSLLLCAKSRIASAFDSRSLRIMISVARVPASVLLCAMSPIASTSDSWSFRTMISVAQAPVLRRRHTTVPVLSGVRRTLSPKHPPEFISPRQVRPPTQSTHAPRYRTHSRKGAPPIARRAGVDGESGCVMWMSFWDRGDYVGTRLVVVGSD